MFKRSFIGAEHLKLYTVKDERVSLNIASTRTKATIFDIMEKGFNGSVPDTHMLASMIDFIIRLNSACVEDEPVSS